MKFFAFRVFLFLVVLINFGCECEQFTENQVLVVIDYTDKRTYDLLKQGIADDLKAIGSRYFRIEGCTGGSLKVIQIRDNCQNTSIFSEKYLPLPSDIDPSEPMPTDFSTFRSALKKIAEAIRSDSSVVAGLGESCIYEPLCNELLSLTNLNTSKESTLQQYVVIYSDMIENDNGISLYGNQKYTAAEFESKLQARYQVSLPDLSNIKFIIVNRRDNQTDDVVRNACLIWKEILEDHGATVKGPLSELEF